MKKTAMQRGVFLLLAAALLWGGWAWSRTPLDAGTVVTEDDLWVVSGRDNWGNFYRATRQGRPASVHLTARYTANIFHLEDETYERDLVFDGEAYTLTGVIGGVNRPFERVYQHLLCYTEEASSATEAFGSATHYVLVDDDTLTWDDICRSWLTVGWESIRSCTVYSEYIWRE